jgi:uncharacterized protein with PQ loop repeat
MIAILGYVATIITIGSFLIKDIIPLRVVNLIGCLVWIVYGILRHDIPIIAVDAAIMLINLVWIFKYIKQSGYLYKSNK